MSKKEIVRKLTSRRMWMSIAGFVSLIIIAAGYTESDAAQVTAIIMAGATVLGYVLGEGLVDSKRADDDGGAGYDNTQVVGFEYDPYDDEEE